MRSHLLLLPICLMFASVAKTQSTTESICNDQLFRVLQRTQGQTIKITCDTVYLLNKGTFKLLNSSYHSFKSQSGALSNFFNATDNYLYEYEQHEQEQVARFDSLRAYFQSLTDSSKQLVEVTNSQLRNISSNISAIESNIDSARIKLESAQLIIQKNEKQKWWDRVKWGLGGLVIGIAATAILLGIK